jgi:ATP-dependent Clp protease ATP-binding subunit ClpB
MEKHSVARLIGAPPGYVGYDEGGQLTEAIRRKPFSVILFDEIEKAHPDVFNVLLQLLDDGRLTDSQGRTVSFKNTVIIMTSNLGSLYLLESLEKENAVTDNAKDKVIEQLKIHFKPEFLNRIDEIVIFNPLNMEEILKIIDISLEHIQRRLDDRNIKLEVSQEAKTYMVKEAYNPVYGARPLKRYLQKHIESEIGKMIVKGSILEDSSIKIHLSEGKLCINC